MKFWGFFLPWSQASGIEADTPGWPAVTAWAVPKCLCVTGCWSYITGSLQTLLSAWGKALLLSSYFFKLLFWGEKLDFGDGVECISQNHIVCLFSCWNKTAPKQQSKTVRLLINSIHHTDVDASICLTLWSSQLNRLICLMKIQFLSVGGITSI